ncbi:MAG: hypothetical protein NHB32_25175 [Fischerella sp. CENA71]|nr:hypothetical protein [Fischerella sp. CENA71]
MKRSLFSVVALLATSTLVIGSPITAFGQNGNAQGSSAQTANDATTSITQTDDLTNTVIQQDDEPFRQVTQARDTGGRRRGGRGRR